MVATQNYEDYVRTAIEAGADLIISGAGLPVTLPDIAAGASSQGRSHSVKLAPIVSSLKSANVIFKYWMKKYDYLPDMVVIEGPLAGGHLGFTREQLQDIPGMHYEEEVERILKAVKAYGGGTGKRDTCGYGRRHLYGRRGRILDFTRTAGSTDGHPFRDHGGMRCPSCIQANLY